MKNKILIASMYIDLGLFIGAMLNLNSPSKAPGILLIISVTYGATFFWANWKDVWR